ncbi:hypothetical protein EDC30_10963 [Paucimonas lemoignei]|uniref:Aminoglycoside phosphotransferase domain-containing protein n=1 Tax=Paucimonas lemoignei TaxID=29443 RepID=A0A4R3HSV9_PAULE|nr:bifunctional aminoglycoside phosphotransferase/ATP-binding protein [Paucimonas lemoignei]TCS35764.1 hypothetical protein EDC30_10963 [Paucimonas lemoignei]
MLESSAQGLACQERLVRSLFKILQGAGPVRLFETHISWVLVVNEYAYKIKKAVHFDFLDFSSLEARRRYCEDELRLNRRLAPELYLDVLAITGSVDTPQLRGDGPAIEYALHMRAFDQDALWSERIAAGLLAPAEIDSLAERMAQFHRSAPASKGDDPWGTPQQLLACANDILSTLGDLLQDPANKPQVAELIKWHRNRHAQLSAAFVRRKREAFVREGHGDLHCANILTLQGQATAFDCIEFSDGLRWIDVLNDIAFAVMDLEVAGRADLAARLLNRYLEAGGDYADLEVLRYYLVLRALVRCKVHLLRMQEVPADSPEHAANGRRMQAYLAYASAWSQSGHPVILIMHGFSGSGKSTVAAAIVEQYGAVRIRSDVERKRMHGLHPVDRSGAHGDLLYSSQASAATYTRLLIFARRIVEAGWPVVVDAAFLGHEQRLQFARLARECRVPFLIVDVKASEATMRERLTKRAAEGKDPSDAGAEVLARQLASHDPLTPEETGHAVAIDSEEGAADAAIRVAVAGLCSEGEIGPAAYGRANDKDA